MCDMVLRLMAFSVMPIVGVELAREYIVPAGRASCTRIIVHGILVLGWLCLCAATAFHGVD